MFEEKVKQAQNAGADAVLISLVDDSPIFIMAGVVDAASEGEIAISKQDEVSIPSVMISLEDANQLRHQLAMSPKESVELRLHAPTQGANSVVSSSPDESSGYPVVSLLENRLQVKGVGKWGVEVSSDPSKRKWQLSIIQDSN